MRLIYIGAHCGYERRLLKKTFGVHLWEVVKVALSKVVLRFVARWKKTIQFMSRQGYHTEHALAQFISPST